MAALRVRHADTSHGKQVLNDAQKPDFIYIPARAGWNGPETQTSSAANPLLERFGPAAQQAATRESLMALATPDLRLWAALAIMIFGLRWLVSKAQKNTPGPVLVEQPRTEQKPSHLRAA